LAAIWDSVGQVVKVGSDPLEEEEEEDSVNRVVAAEDLD
jgi:hypothetical protein